MSLQQRSQRRSDDWRVPANRVVVSGVRPGEAQPPLWAVHGHPLPNVKKIRQDMGAGRERGISRPHSCSVSGSHHSPASLPAILPATPPPRQSAQSGFSGANSSENCLGNFPNAPDCRDEFETGISPFALETGEAAQVDIAGGCAPQRGDGVVQCRRVSRHRVTSIHVVPGAKDDGLAVDKHEHRLG